MKMHIKLRNSGIATDDSHNQAQAVEITMLINRELEYTETEFRMHISFATPIPI